MRRNWYQHNLVRDHLTHPVWIRLQKSNEEQANSESESADEEDGKDLEDDAEEELAKLNDEGWTKYNFDLFQNRYELGKTGQKWYN